MSDLRVVFMGTPELAAASLRALLGAPDIQLIAVVTQPDQPKGRGLKLHPSPVKEIAREQKLPVLQPTRARDEQLLEELRRLQPDLIVVTAYGQILPRTILELPRFGCINVHTSLLPKYRGAAPIQWALLNDETETGVTIMQMDPGMDTGPILTQQKTPITSDDNSQTLHDRLGGMGANLLVKTIPDYVNGAIRPQPQPAEGASHAPKIKKQDGLIDWHQSARAIWNRVRAMIPWPGAFTHFTDATSPHLLKIWDAEVIAASGHAGDVLDVDKNRIVVGCGTGALSLRTVQKEGGRQMSVQEFLAGHRLRPGQRLG